MGLDGPFSIYYQVLTKVGSGSLGWSILPGVTLYWRSWGEETIVYNDASRDTHLLGPLDAAVLKRLQEGFANIPDLVAHVSEMLDVKDDDELYFYVDELVAKLARLALVEHVSR